MTNAFPLNKRPLRHIIDNNRVQSQTIDLSIFQGSIFVLSKGEKNPQTICLTL